MANRHRALNLAHVVRDNPYQPSAHQALAHLLFLSSDLISLVSVAEICFYLPAIDIMVPWNDQHPARWKPSQIPKKLIQPSPCGRVLPCAGSALNATPPVSRIRSGLPIFCNGADVSGECTNDRSLIESWTLIAEKVDVDRCTVSRISF